MFTLTISKTLEFKVLNFIKFKYFFLVIEEAFEAAHIENEAAEIELAQLEEIII